ncbi:MAG: acyl-CoA dehydrogenase [Rhodoferax sp.]|jgi:3-oxochol-4-en-24-oyl-CoA dehydrogenase|nr:acyl-CoA dehydrogenase [Rhodoferax sp.]
MTHLDSTQTLLRDSVQAFNARKPGASRMRRLRDAGERMDRSIWQEMAESGWCGVLVPEDMGGIGLGAAEAAIIAGELGRGLAPEPYVAATALVVQALMPLASQSAVRDLLGRISDGSCVAALAWQERPGAYAPADAGMQALVDAGGWRLHGSSKSFIPDADAADGFVVYAREENIPVLLWVPADTPGLRVSAAATVDGQSLGSVDLQTVRLPASALLARGTEVDRALTDAITLARLLSAFELIGVLDKALAATLDYTRQRIQFGRPIATFQALQHRMVDMWMQGQLAHAAADHALQQWLDGAARPATTQAVHAARARACGAALFVCKAAIHLHGAMGIADETDIGLCLKRALSLSAWLGNAAWQRAQYLDHVLRDGRASDDDAVPGATADDANLEPGTDIADLPDEHFRQVLARWIAANYPPHKRFMKKRAFFADISDWYLALSRQGWLAPAWPKEHGGMGLSAAKQVIYYEEMTRHGCARIPDHGLVVGQLLLHYGTPEQIAFHLPRILNGENMWCQGYSEPNAGSDLASLRTRAEREGNELVITGQKIWTTLGTGSNWMFALVRTSKPEGGRQRGITFVLIDLRSEGVRVRPIVNLKGEGEFSEVFFDAVRVPVGNVVGNIDDGWTVANSLLRSERIFFGTPRQCEHALGQLDRLARATQALNDGGFRDRYATLVLDVRDLKSAFEYFVGRLRAGEELGSEVSYLKVWGTETYQRITDELVQLAGDYGSQQDDVCIDGIAIDVMNQYLDSRAPAIFSGSNEIQRNILAKQILSLPSWAGERA